jgi:periplasmic protein TonB
MIRLFFLASTPHRPEGAYLPSLNTGFAPNGWRSVGVALAAAIAALVHGIFFVWYFNRPEPLPFAEAAPLPMIDMLLAAPPAPPLTQPKVPPPPVPPKEAKKPDPKPVKRPKPKPEKSESVVKKAEPQKDEPETAPPAPSSAPAPTRDRATAPRNEPFTPASSNANYLNNPKPVYPGIARSRHWEGLVYLRVYVTSDGHAAEVDVQRSSGHEVLDESALEAVRKWRFVPAKRGDLAQASWVTVPIEFELE